MLGQLLKQFSRRWTGIREIAPSEVRDLIDASRLDDAWTAIAQLASLVPQREAKQVCLRGEIEFRRHRDAEAEALFRQALKEVPGLPDAHYGLSLVMLARGDKELALRHATFAANNSAEARMSAHLGLCHIELQNYIRASEALKRATHLGSSDKSSWNNLGIARRALGDGEGARLAFARALEIDPSFVSAKTNAALLEDELVRVKAATGQAPKPEHAAEADSPASLQLHEVSLAIDRQEQLCLDHPAEAAPVIELARLYRVSGDAQSGVDALWAFLAQYPDDLAAVAAQGRALVDLKAYKEALPLVERALQAGPDDVELLLARSAIHSAQDRLSDAGRLLERVYELQPTFHNKGRLAASLSARCRYEEALALVSSMKEERPASARDTLGIKMDALIALGRHDEALPELDALIVNSPNDANYRFLRASINLLNENFAVGWADYAYRNLQSTRHLRMLPFPLWEGQPLEGKTIVIAAEQGLGDQVMFASCLPEVLALRPKRLIIEAIDRVAPTLARSFPECEVIATKQDSKLDWVRDLQDVDYFALIADLPRLFRRRREDFPQHSGYFVPDPARVNHWRAQLDSLDPLRRPRIGVTWRGGMELTRKTVRSMAVTDLQLLTGAIDATWVNLQYGDVGEDLVLAAAAGMQLAHWPQAIKDLDEFAALISALDLVVTVCNTTVHYAGAVGKDVWVMAPKVPEWRYGLAFERMPWYPSSRVFRQPQAGDWESVLHAVAEEVRTWSSNRSTQLADPRSA
jgi:tetratricopeptide (TPR) repeat protein